jgi:hypothetical protein
MSIIIWHLQFYHANPNGTRIGGDIVNDTSPFIDLGIDQAKSMLQNITFHWGKPNVCLVKSQDGSIVREVIGNA